MAYIKCVFFLCSPEFGSKEDIEKLFSWETSVEQYTSLGGTSKSSVTKQIEQLNEWLNLKQASCKQH